MKYKLKDAPKWLQLLVKEAGIIWDDRFTLTIDTPITSEGKYPWSIRHSGEIIIKIRGFRYESSFLESCESRRRGKADSSRKSKS